MIATAMDQQNETNDIHYTCQSIRQHSRTLGCWNVCPIRDLEIWMWLDRPLVCQFSWLIRSCRQKCLIVSRSITLMSYSKCNLNVFSSDSISLANKVHSACISPALPGVYFLFPSQCLRFCLCNNANIGKGEEDISSFSTLDDNFDCIETKLQDWLQC